MLQILALIKEENQLMARRFLRIAVTAIELMLKQHPTDAKRHLLVPLLDPLLGCLDRHGRLSGRISTA